MLIYNFNRVFKAKGIERPFTFLCKAGFSSNFATRIKNNQVKQLRTSILERLCEALKCTPNDLMEWQPDKDSQVSETHPLLELQRKDKVHDLTRTLNALPLNKLNRLEELIKEMD